MSTIPTITKTIRIPWTLHEEALKRLQPGESFTSFINRLIADELKKAS